MTKYKLVIADIDGTLIPPSELPASRPSERLISDVKYITQKGIIFSLASARSLPWISEIIKPLNLKSPVILDNGARIYDLGKKDFIWNSFIPKVKAEEIFALLKKEKDIRIFATDDGIRHSDLSKITGWKISKILVLGITPQKADYLFGLIGKLSGISATVSVSGTGDKSRSIHITNLDATKKTAVERIRKILNIKKAETIGIGDSYNDLPLLSACGLKVAMGNSVNELKKIADYITSSYNEDGVARVLEKFIIDPGK